MLETDNTSRIFFVDFENVKISGLDGLLELNSTDEVFIFYSDKADGITFDVHKNLNETKAKINLQKVEVGSKNALDFYITTYIGSKILEEENEAFCIVSKDKGFSAVVDLSWWEQELPSQEEMEEGKRNLKANGNAVDFIITHCCSSSTEVLIGGGMYKSDYLNDYLESLRQSVQFKKWFFGHYHGNRNVNAQEILIYEQIIRIV